MLIDTSRTTGYGQPPLGRVIHSGYYYGIIVAYSDKLWRRPSNAMEIALVQDWPYSVRQRVAILLTFGSPIDATTIV